MTWFVRLPIQRIVAWTVLAAVGVLLAVVGVGALTKAVDGGRLRTNLTTTLLAVRPRSAPAFSLAILGGGMPVGVSSYRGKTVVVNFWASWCKPCRDETPELESLWESVRDRGDIQFLGIDVWDQQKDGLAFAREFHVSYPLVVDAKGKAAIDYGLTGVPETFIIDSRGMIVRHAIGPTSAQQLRATLAEVAPQPTAAPR